MDELQEALNLAGRGMGVVFLALTLLLLLMLGLRRLLSERQFVPPLAVPAAVASDEMTPARPTVHPRSAAPGETRGEAAAGVSAPPAVPAEVQGPATTSVSATPAPTDDELEQVAVLAAAMAMAMDAELEAWPGPLPLPARASAVWRYQGRLDLMQGQGRPRLGWRR